MVTATMATRAIVMLNRFWADLPLRVRALALLLIPLPVLIVAGITIHRDAHGEQEARAQIAHTAKVRSRIQDFTVLLLDAEASVREFTAGGDTKLLRPYLRAKELSPAAGAQLQKLVQNNALQSGRWREIETLVAQEFEFLETLSRSSPGRPLTAEGRARAALLLDQGQRISGALRVKLAAMQTEEDRSLQLRSQGVDSLRFRLVAILVESAVIGIFFQMVGTLVLAGAVSGQIRAIEANAQLFCQGQAPKRLVLESRELYDLGKRLQDAAIVAEGHEREVRQSEERFRALFNDAPIAYHEIDRQGVIRHVNLAECTLLGVEREHLVGKPVWETAGASSRETVERNVLERLAENRPATPYECDYECRDHSLVTVEVHENLIRDNQGKVIGIRSALLDVTARKMVDMASKKVEQYARELRTKNEELLLALTAAREASATKGRFLAAMSHELRTPLNGIIGLTELMYDGLVGAVSEEHQEYLGDILASSRHLLQLVSEVLDLAKIESGKMEFRSERVEIGPLLQEVHDVMRILADKKNLSIAIETDEKIQTVMTDGARLKQVVYNYLSNAIKFTPEGGTIRVRAVWENTGFFRVEVEDTGPGIPECDLPRLFEDFEQLDEARPNQGTGLGLALTKRIAESQGGAVGVRSVPGSGSIFYAILPSGSGHPGTEGNEDPEHASAGAFFSTIPIRPEIVRSV